MSLKPVKNFTGNFFIGNLTSPKRNPKRDIVVRKNIAARKGGCGGLSGKRASVPSFLFVKNGKRSPGTRFCSGFLSSVLFQIHQSRTGDEAALLSIDFRYAFREFERRFNASVALLFVSNFDDTHWRRHGPLGPIEIA